MIDIDSLDYTGHTPMVYFRWKGIDMDAELDPCVIKPVVVKGTARGSEVDVVFDDYEKLSRELRIYVDGVDEATGCLENCLAYDVQQSRIKTLIDGNCQLWKALVEVRELCDHAMEQR